MLQESRAVRSTFFAFAIEHLPAVIRLAGYGPAWMITDSIPDIIQIVGLFRGIAPVHALEHPLDFAALGMGRDLNLGAKRRLALVFAVVRVVFDNGYLDLFIEMNLALALGATKALERTGTDYTVTLPLQDEITRSGEHFQAVE